MPTPARAIASLAAFFDATSALHATILKLGIHTDPDAYFFADTDHPSGPTFLCGHLVPNSSHASLAIHPMITAGQKAWQTFVADAYACSPTLTSSTMDCLQDIGRQAQSISTPLQDRALNIYLHREKFTFPNVATFLDKMQAYLTTTHTLPAGIHPFTIHHTLPTKGGCARTQSKTVQAVDAQAAVRLWVASNSLLEQPNILLSVVQTHDHEALLEAIQA